MGNIRGRPKRIRLCYACNPSFGANLLKPEPMAMNRIHIPAAAALCLFVCVCNHSAAQTGDCHGTGPDTSPEEIIPAMSSVIEAVSLNAPVPIEMTIVVPSMV